MVLRSPVTITHRRSSTLPFDDGAGQWAVGVGKGKLNDVVPDLNLACWHGVYLDLWVSH